MIGIYRRNDSFYLSKSGELYDNRDEEREAIVMKNFGELFLEAMTDGKLSAVADDLQRRYLKETTMDDILKMICLLKEEAKQSENTVDMDGYLMIKNVRDEMDRHAQWQLRLIAPHHNEQANLLSPKELFRYPFPKFSDDITVLSDIIWDMTLGSDQVDGRDEVPLDEQASEFSMDDKEVSDHVYNDDWEDEGSQRYHEPETNL